MIDPSKRHPGGFFGLLDRIEEALLGLMLAAMILFACLQIFLRYVYSGGLLWIDPLLRYLVLWCGLVGALSATSQGKHIALDLTAGRIPPAVEPWLRSVTYLFCTLASAGLTWAGWFFLVGEIDSGATGPLSLPLWFWNGIFPAVFALMTLKYLLLLAMQAKKLLSGRTTGNQES